MLTTPREAKRRDALAAKNECRRSSEGAHALSRHDVVDGDRAALFHDLAGGNRANDPAKRELSKYRWRAVRAVFFSEVLLERRGTHRCPFLAMAVISALCSPDSP